MEPQKRFHPHTRKEWDEIRPIFTDLYQAQQRKLSEIIDILGERGFHARECHYKTYIKKWGLDKKNKQSDMVFAFRKLRERQGKDTVFKIRGQTRTRGDVEHYWKRRRLDPAGFSPVPNTPDGLKYRTPSPFPGKDLLGVEAQNTMPDEISSPFAADQRNDHLRDSNQELRLTPRPSSLRLLSSPEPFRSRDRALHYAQVYLRGCLENRSLNQVLDPWHESSGVSNLFQCRAFNTLAAIEYGLSQINIQVFQAELFEFTPELVTHSGPYLMATLLNIIAQYTHAARRTNSNRIKMLSHEIVNRIARANGEAHPLALILQILAAERSFGDMTACSESIMSASKDILAHGLGYEHSDTRNLLLVASAISQASGDRNAALRYAKEVYRIDSSRQGVTVTDNDLFSLLESQYRLVYYHTNLGNYEEAEGLVEDGLRRCSDLTFPGDQNIIRSLFLYHQGLIKERYGQLYSAIESLNEALQLRLRLFGAGDYVAASIAQWLRHIFEKQRRVQIENDAQGGPRVQVQGRITDEAEELLDYEDAEQPIDEDAELWTDAEAERSIDEEAEPSNVGATWPSTEGYQDLWIDEEPEMWTYG